MHGHEFVNDQLDSVGKSYDWSRHGQLMADLDAELAELNQKIRTLLSLHEFLVELDAICIRKIEAGQAAPNPEMARMLLTVLNRSQETSSSLLTQADAFMKKGIPVTGCAVLRMISRDPSDKLEMAGIARLALELDDGSPVPREMPLSDDVLSALSRSDKSHRHLGND
jgi:hypothetical protein